MKSKQSTPPKFARKILLAFLRDDLAEEVLGDLHEKFYATARKKSPLRAKVNYWYQVLHYMRPFAIRKGKSISLNQYDMLQNYFKIGIRNLLKSRFFSLINISGMAISMAILFIITLYIHDELKFDKHIADSALKFRVFNEQFVDGGTNRKLSLVPPMIGPGLAKDFPEVEYYTRYLDLNFAPLFEVGTKKFAESKGGLADPTIFGMFSVNLLEGDAGTALRDPNTVAINETLKRKYFGDEPALGKTMEIFDTTYMVAAVFEDLPPYGHFQRNYFLALQGAIPEERMQLWIWSQFHTYIKLKPGTAAEGLESKLKDFAERNAWPSTKQHGGYYIPHLMPIEKIHLYAHDQAWDVAVRGNIQTIYILMAVAAFILVISILNFVNLSTARAINRVKEVGVRKVMGAFRIQLVYQFVSESVLIALVALVVAAGAASLAIPFLNDFADKNIPIGVFVNPMVMLGLLVFAVFMGILAGVYPGFVISAHQPTRILSVASHGRPARSLFRNALVVFQFVLSFFLIIASFVVSQQHAYMRNADMGFEKENIVVLPLRGDMGTNPQTTKEAFGAHPSILSTSIGYGLPGEAYAGDGIIDKATGKQWHINMLIVDHDYVKTLGLEILAGRDFSRDIPTDVTSAFIISEAAAKMLGYTDPADALGHEVAWNRWDAPDSRKEGRVIGIVRDVQLNSMRENIAPLALQIFPFGYNTLTMRIQPNNIPATIDHMEKTWKTFNSEWPFEFRFLDENFDKMYKAEEKLATLFGIFTGFTILVACLGLFGLVVYSTSQRYREISIRKVLGAKETNLVILLARRYVLLIAIAFLIAIPLSYYAAMQWLQTFAFRIGITPFLFVKAGAIIVAIALVTVGIQSYKATLANPVDALKES